MCLKHWNKLIGFMLYLLFAPILIIGYSLFNILAQFCICLQICRDVFYPARNIIKSILPKRFICFRLIFWNDIIINFSILISYLWISIAYMHTTCIASQSHEFLFCLRKRYLWFFDFIVKRFHGTLDCINVVCQNFHCSWCCFHSTFQSQRTLYKCRRITAKHIIIGSFKRQRLHFCLNSTDNNFRNLVKLCYWII